MSGKDFRKKKKKKNSLKKKLFYSLFYLSMPVAFFLPVAPQRHRVAQHSPLPHNGSLAHHDPERVAEQDAGDKKSTGVQVRSQNLRAPRL